jgi:hypothetical protein
MSRRHHTAHDLASLRIDLYGETAKAPSTQIFGRKARGTVDKRVNVSATIPFEQKKRNRADNETIREEEANIGAWDSSLSGQFGG